MNKFFFLPLVFAPAAAQAVCVPTNEFHTIFLGISADDASYATASSDRVLHLKDQKPEASHFKNHICFYNIENNSKQGECLELASNTNKIEEAKALLQKEFKRNFKGWIAKKASASKRSQFLPLLNCENVSKETPQCQFELRKARNDRYLDLIWARTIPLRATFDVSPLLHTSQEMYFSKDKKNICVRFERIAHQSANCGSREDIIVCGASEEKIK